MTLFELRKIWEDDDGMVQVELSVSNGRQTTTQDFYSYPSKIERFGNELSDYFPEKGKGEIIFEYGEEGGRMYSFVFLKAFYITLNKTGMLVRTNNNQHGYEATSSQFCIESSLSEFNRLGASIRKWAMTMEEPLSCRLQNA